MTPPSNIPTGDLLDPLDVKRRRKKSFSFVVHPQRFLQRWIVSAAHGIESIWIDYAAALVVVDIFFFVYGRRPLCCVAAALDWIFSPWCSSARLSPPSLSISWGARHPPSSYVSLLFFYVSSSHLVSVISCCSCCWPVRVIKRHYQQGVWSGHSWRVCFVFFFTKHYRDVPEGKESISGVPCPDSRERRKRAGPDRYFWGVFFICHFNAVI